MRTDWWKTILSVCLVLAVTGWGGLIAGEVAKEEQIAAEPPPGPGGPMQGRRFEMGPEQTEQMLARIRETNPQKADELAQLREKDPNAFRAELRNFMREQFAKRMKEQTGEPGRWQHGPEGQMPGVPGRGAEAGMGHVGPFPEMNPEMMRERIQERSEEYMKCLKDNFPDEAAKLEQLKKDNPEQYMRALMISGKKYDRICQAVKNDPNLAKVLKQQMELKGKRAELLKQIKATTDEKQKKELTAELEQIVAQQFDLIVKRKQMAYEDLTKKLEELKKEVDQRKAEVEKWKNADFKKQQVKQRVNELINEAEKFEWEN
jgi:ribosomal protein L29